MPSNLYRRGGIWYCRFVVGGDEIRRSLQTRDRRQAEARAAKLRDELNRRKWGDERHTWMAAVGRWFEEAGRHSKPGTIERYRTSFQACRDLLHAMHLDEIDRTSLRRIASRAGVTNATRKRDLTAVSAVLRAAVGWGWLDSNPVRDFDRSTLRHREPVMVLPADAEVERLIRALPPMLGRMVRLLVETGLRLEEAASLRWPQVDLTRRAVQLGDTKTGKPRAVPLTDLAVSTLSGTPRRMGCDWVFWHGQQQPDRYHNLASQLLGRKKALGMIWRVHDLRHLFAVRYLRGGGSIYTLKEILGHGSVLVTERYLSHLTPEEAEATRKRA